jgi:hypothetical protein
MHALAGEAILEREGKTTATTIVDGVTFWLVFQVSHTFFKFNTISGDQGVRLKFPR